MCRVDRLVSQFGIKQENNLRCNVETVPCSWLQFSRIVTPCCDASSRRLRPSPLPRSPNRRRRTIRDGWTGRSWVLRCYWVAHQLWEPSDSLLTIQKSNSIVKKKNRNIEANETTNVPRRTRLVTVDYIVEMVEQYILIMHFQYFNHQSRYFYSIKFVIQKPYFYFSKIRLR